jgi:hypothetical protein
MFITKTESQQITSFCNFSEEKYIQQVFVQYVEMEHFRM